MQKEDCSERCCSCLKDRLPASSVFCQTLKIVFVPWLCAGLPRLGSGDADETPRAPAAIPADNQQHPRSLPLLQPHLCTEAEQGSLTRSPDDVRVPLRSLEMQLRAARASSGGRQSRIPGAHWMAVLRCLTTKATSNFFFLVSCSAHLSYAYKGFHTFFINATNNWRTSPALRFKQWV